MSESGSSPWFGSWAHSSPRAQSCVGSNPVSSLAFLSQPRRLYLSSLPVLSWSQRSSMNSLPVLTQPLYFPEFPVCPDATTEVINKPSPCPDRSVDLLHWSASLPCTASNTRPGLHYMDLHWIMSMDFPLISPFWSSSLCLGAVLWQFKAIYYKIHPYLIRKFTLSN